MLAWLYGSLSPWVRLGERHNQGPFSGDIARHKVTKQDLTGLVDMSTHDRLAAARPAGAASAGLSCTSCVGKPSKERDTTPKLTHDSSGPSIVVEMGVQPSAHFTQ